MVEVRIVTSGVSVGTVYAALMGGHDVGDHVVQTDHQAASKAGRGAAAYRALAGHVGGYTVTQVVALALVGVPLLRWRTVAGLAFSAGTHAFIDRRWPVRALLRLTRSPAFAELQTPINGMYVSDQALHHGCLLVAARIIAG
jgi:hypothetical protein